MSSERVRHYFLLLFVSTLLGCRAGCQRDTSDRNDLPISKPDGPHRESLLPDYGSQTDAEVTCGWKVMALPGGVNVRFNGVAGSGPSNVFIVGESGTVFHYGGTAWTKMSVPTSLDLYGVWASSSNSAFAGGEAGTILSYDGNIWKRLPSAPSSWLYSIWGSSPNDVYFVGLGEQDAGVVIRYNGNTFAIQSPATGWWYDVSGSGPSDVWVVGNIPNSGAVAHYDGKTWTDLDLWDPVSSRPRVSFLHSIWCFSASDVWLVDESFLHYDGKALTKVAIPTAGVTPSDIWGSGPSDVFAVGDSGTIMHYNGAQWSIMPSGTSHDLHGIWGSGPSDVFAVGDSNTVVHYSCVR